MDFWGGFWPGAASGFIVGAFLGWFFYRLSSKDLKIATEELKKDTEGLKDQNEILKNNINKLALYTDADENRKLNLKLRVDKNGELQLADQIKLIGIPSTVKFGAFKITQGKPIDDGDSAPAIASSTAGQT